MPEVTLARNPSERGGKYVCVDGNIWGLIHMRQHGGQGTSYSFGQYGGGDICRNGILVTVNGDKRARRGRKKLETTLEDRLLSEATSLVKDGLLKSRGAHQDEQKLIAEEQKRLWERREQDELERFRAKAQEVISVYFLSGPNRDELITRVASLMKWAQSQ